MAVILKMMEIKRKKSTGNLLIVLVFLLSGCASQIEVLTPASLFLNPEASGKSLKGDITAHTYNGAMLGIALSSSSDEPLLETARSQIALGSTAAMGVHEYLDFYAKAGTHSPYVLGVKLQLYGDNQVDTYSGNLSFSLLFGGGQNNYHGSGNENYVFSTSGDYRLNRTHTSFHLGALVGYRYEKYMLFYSGLNKLSENVHGTADFEGSPVDDSQIDINGNHLQLILGYLYDYDQYNLVAEYSLSQISWQGDSQKLIQTFNVGIGFDF